MVIDDIYRTDSIATSGYCYTQINIWWNSSNYSIYNSRYDYVYDIDNGSGYSKNYEYRKRKENEKGKNYGYGYGYTLEFIYIISHGFIL